MSDDLRENELLKLLGRVIELINMEGCLLCLIWLKKKKSSSLSSYQLVLYILLFLVLLKKILILWMPPGILSIKIFNNNTFLKVWTYDFLHVAMVCTTKGSYCWGNLCWSLLFTCISLCRSLNRESKREKKTTIIWWIMKLQGQTYSFIHFIKMSDWKYKSIKYKSLLVQQ